MASVLDQFVQFAAVKVPSLAAGSGTKVEQLVTGITNMQKVAWELYRVCVDIPGVWMDNTRLAAWTDYLRVGITQSSSDAQGIDAFNASLVDYWNITSAFMATSVDIHRPVLMPFIHEFAEPRLILPQNIFAILKWVTSANLTVDSVSFRIWYKEHEVTAADWYDLLQLRLPLGAT